MSIYFITTPSGHVKIGFTDGSPAFRLMNLQIGSWEPLTLALVIQGGEKQERWYHRLFERDHVRGDWFRVSPQIKKFMDPIERARKLAMFEKRTLWVAEDGTWMRGLPPSKEPLI